MQVVYPPDQEGIKTENKSVFLAGSIEMGVAEDWQTRVLAMLENTRWTVFNPRRKDWDSSWVQSIKNPKFVEQVYWELEALERATYIIMYFDPATKSPISLLELGLFARTGKLIVVCPDGFWRQGNVDCVCAKYMVLTTRTLEEAVEWVISTKRC